MKTNIISAIILVGFIVVNGCVSSNSSHQKTMASSSQVTDEEKETLVGQYLKTGQAYEQQGRLNSALEQYDLALTVLPDHALAGRAKQEVTSKLKDKARTHYQQGVAYDKDGQYEAARQQYLSALQNWPDYKQAKKRLTPGGVADENREYITHTLKYGESVSKISLIYYGTLIKHDIIGKFNILKDAKKVRVGQTLKVPVIQGISLADLNQKKTAYLEGHHPEPSDKSSDNYSDIADDETALLTEETAQEDPLPKMDSPGERETERDTNIDDYASMTSADSLEDSVPDALPESAEDAQISEAEPSEEPIEAQDKTSPPIQETVQTASIDQHPVPPVTAHEDSTESLSDRQEGPEQPEQAPVDIYQLGIEQFKKKEYSKAIDNFTQALDKEPDNEILRDYLFQSHFQNGLYLYKKSKYLTAKDNFSQAWTHNPACDKCQENIQKSENSYKEKHYNLGIHYFGKENLKKAISEWKKVQKIDPAYKEVAPNLKKAELLSKRLEAIKKSSSN